MDWLTAKQRALRDTLLCKLFHYHRHVYRVLEHDSVPNNVIVLNGLFMFLRVVAYDNRMPVAKRNPPGKLIVGFDLVGLGCDLI